MSVLSLAQTLTSDQKAQLLAIADECRALGATSYELSPLMAVLYLADSRPIEEGIDEMRRNPALSEFFD